MTSLLRQLLRRPLARVIAASLLFLVLLPPQPAGDPPTRSGYASSGVTVTDSLRLVLAELPTTTTTTTTVPQPVEGNTRAMYAQAHHERVVYGTGACGGDLPSCSVLDCESGGNLVAQNPHSTASGKWQILDSTWRTEDSDGDGKRDSYQGYSRAMDAPESVQDDRAREIWNGGAGRSQWVCK